MRVLYFSPRECWPITCGANLRDYHLARALSERASVTYAGMSTWYGDGVWRGRQGREGELESILVHRRGAYSLPKIVRGLVGPSPLSVLNYSTAAMNAQLRQLLDEGDFDLVQVEGVHLSSYVPLIRASRSRPRIVCDWHNIESEILRRYSESDGASTVRRLYAAHTARLLERLEDRLLRECDAHLVCSERERRLLLERVPGARIAVVPNGVDCAFAAALPQTTPLHERTDLVFVGSMNYHANVDAVLYFAKEVWPNLRARDKNLRFVIVGAHPSAEVLALREMPGVVVTGTVDDVRPYYQSAAAVVAPIRVGGGTRLKIVEAMASGVPVISTKLGAEGLSVADRHDILLADTPIEFASALAIARRDQQTWDRIANAGRETARAYDWARIGGDLYRFYADSVLDGKAVAIR